MLFIIKKFDEVEKLIIFSLICWANRNFFFEIGSLTKNVKQKIDSALTNFFLRRLLWPVESLVIFLYYIFLNHLNTILNLFKFAIKDEEKQKIFFAKVIFIIIRFERKKSYVQMKNQSRLDKNETCLLISVLTNCQWSNYHNDVIRHPLIRRKDKTKDEKINFFQKLFTKSFLSFFHCMYVLCFQLTSLSSRE